MEDIDLTCPVTKKPCPLHDIGSGNRHWCDDRGDPSEYEVCPIPRKAEGKTAINSLLHDNHRSTE